MPDEYISREAALVALQDSDLFNTTERQLRAIRELPAADVTPVVHGQWALKVIDDAYEPVCSACGYIPGIRFWNAPYCPSCGARMDGRCSQCG